ncbi:unnamed protein product [Sphenostylis stenocarpa]|uniref:Uncharacterized protein n=1 Tax=Sphenostylis stenocarpa TaxID=92480 RepID=A0AA86W4Y6_9FABA|nr:unnamed protein product [Sphenostylis stenocarpa]
MDVEDAENEVSISSAILNSITSGQNDLLSPEDLAWADSCLVKDSDISETDWVPLKNALLEIISSQSQYFSTEGEDIEIPPYSSSSERITVELNQQSSTSDGKCLSQSFSTYIVNPLHVAVETSADDIPDDETIGTLPSFNPCRPTYNENLKVNETIDFELNLDTSSYETEHLAENIFKIWDFDIPSEEGDLVKQLEKALSENSFQTVPSSFDDSVKWKDTKDNSFDDLVAGIADLSLKKNA